eukprot:TRINITY_DN6951_c0_g1_i3.p1 TRINITY_DN6951_c0_g1~~TRINITY_DN6951_c0_g1_i3.p1  ORF type:complete len:791 (+),score=189.23 TRINITY_DN6951_c0_g1_i3:272-2374(+)
MTKLAKQMNEVASGKGFFTNRFEEKFVIVSGNVSFDVVEVIARELYHPDTETSEDASVNRRVVILSKSIPGELHERADEFLSNPDHGGKIYVLDGSPMNDKDLLHRARAAEADAIFILSRRLCGDPAKQDTANVFRALAVQRAVPDLQIFMSLHDSSSRNLLSDDFVNNSCIFASQTQMQTLAISALVPGFSTLLYSLCRTFQSTVAMTSHARPAMRRFVEGVDHEIYILRSDVSLKNVTLGDLARNLYEAFDIIVIAFICRECKQIIFDCKSRMPENSKVVMIAPDRNAAQAAIQSARIDQSEEDETEQHASGDDFGCEHLIHDPRTRKFKPAMVDKEVELSDIPPLLNPEGHAVVICSSTSALPDFIRRFRAVERSHEQAIDLKQEDPEQFEKVPIIVACPQQQINPQHFLGMRSSELHNVFFYKKELVSDIDFKRCRVEAAKVILVTNMQQGELEENAENDLVEVSSVLMLTKLNKYLADAEDSKDPFVITELFNESAVRYVTASSRPLYTLSSARSSSFGFESASNEIQRKKPGWLKQVKGFFDAPRVNEKDDLWTSSLFASGGTYLHNLPDLILSHAYLNSGYLNFINTILSNCGDTFTLKNEPVSGYFEEEQWKQAEKEPTMGQLFQKLLRHNKIPLGLYRNTQHTACHCLPDHISLGGEDDVKFDRYLEICPKPNVILCSGDQVMTIHSKLCF